MTRINGDEGTPAASALLTPDDVGAFVEVVFGNGHCFTGTLRGYTATAAHLTGDDGREKRMLLDGAFAVIVGRAMEAA